MPAQVVNFAQWKAAHPPALICWNHGLQCYLAWHDLWLKVLFQRKQ